MDATTEPLTPGLSLRSNFAWILTGNVVYAACQWGAIVALAKLGSSFMIGQFSLGLAIATPVLMFTNLHLRAVQATDARRLYFLRGISATPHRHDAVRPGGNLPVLPGSETMNGRPRW